MLGVQIAVAVMAALNVALNTWLVQRRKKADEREAQRPSPEEWKAFELWREYVKTPDDLFDER